MRTRLPSWLAPLVGGLALAAVFGAHLAHYHPFFADDGFISLRYAQRLLDGHGLTWTAGEAVEGYSNLAWILLISGLGAVGLDLVDAARLLGGLCGLATVALVFRGRLDGFVPAIALALSGPLAVWSVGGLEQPLVAALLATALVTLGRRLSAPTPGWISGIALALLCLTRPDGPLFVAVFAGVLLLGQRRLRPALHLAALPLVAVAGQLLFRRLYYADWLPNPAWLKANWSGARLADGLDYVGDGLWTLLPVLCLGLLGAVAGGLDRARRGRVALAWTAAIAWTGYVASVGGDIFPAHRHLVPTLVLLAFAGVEGVGWALERAGDRRALAIPLVGLVCALVPLQQGAEANGRARTERWEWDAVPVGRLLRAAFADRDPLLAVTAAGALPYFSKLRCLDMLGLNDRHIARQRAETDGYIAHDHADGGYVLDRAPDLMIWGTPRGGAPRHAAGRQVQADPRFARDYRRVLLETRAPRLMRVTAYVHAEGRLGIERSPERIRYPAWHLGAPAVGVLDGGDALVARIPANTSLKTAPIALPAGRWTLATDPPDGALGLSLESQIPLRLGAQSFAGPATVRVRVRAGRVPSDLRALVFTSSDAPSDPQADRAGRELVLREPPTVDATSPLRLIHAFDAPDAAGWTLDGIAIAVGAVPGQAPILGRTGGVLNSFTPGRGDRQVGRARSPEFSAPPRTALSFRLAGGDSGVGVRLYAGGRAIAQWTGQRDERLRLVRLDLTAHADRPLQLEVFDGATGPWGHVVVDDVQLVPWAPAQSVSKRMP